MKKTKIVSTLGPASFDVDTISKLIDSGANIFRFNFSHGSHPEHLKRYHMVQEAEKRTGKTVGIDLDTKGAEIRTTENADGKIQYHTGDKMVIAMDPNDKTTHDKINVTYTGLFDDVHEGGHVLFDDGILDTVIDSKDASKKELHVTAQNAAVLGSRKTADAPGVSINLPGITEKDSDDIEFGLDNMNINFITASFVRKPQDVIAIRKLLDKHHMEDVQIFPKIENQEGIDNLEPIMKVSDGLMVPRGDMAVNIPFENVPLVQNHMIHRCNEMGKPVITATQMLASMANNPRPSRAEVSDVANAVWDGTDATMLSGESANGAYPIKSVAAMARIDVKAENAFEQYGNFVPKFDKGDVTEAIGNSVSNMAKQLGINTIVTVTASGYTARMLSKYHPDANILAITFDDRTRRGLEINWGVHPIVADKPSNTDEMFDLAAKKALETGLAKEGDLILTVGGSPVGEKGTTNLVRVQLIGSKLTQGQGIGDKSIIGKAFVANSADEANKKATKGGILVAKNTNKDYMPAIKKASALVVEDGGLTSYAAVAGISMGLPVVVSASHATEKISDGDVVTVDSRRGIVYHGATKSM